jgi:predicted amidohydrolase YtcJ
MRVPRRVTPADLLILNANVVTLDPSRPFADAVAVRGGRILAVGSHADVEGLAGRGARRFDAQGRLLTPGFIDPHLHLLAYAAHLRSLDLSGVRFTSGLQALLRAHASTLSPGAWLRAAGYDEWALREKRHVTRHDLDAAVPDRPVRLVHRSTHASVLNSRGLAEAGVRFETEEPPGGTIDRETPSGEPSGLLIDMEAWLGERVPPLPQVEMEAGVEEASRRLLSWGVTAVEDATPNLEPDLHVLASLADSGRFKPALAAMVDVDTVLDMDAAGIRSGEALGALTVREAKIMVSASSGRVTPDWEDLVSMIATGVNYDYPVALHIVELEALRALFRAMDELGRVLGDFGWYKPFRIEHASICPPEALVRLRWPIGGSDWAVVTQPGFLYWSGDRYLAEVDPEERRWLYRTTSLLRDGILVAASSDAPVIPPDPRYGLYGAMARRSRLGAGPVGDDPPMSAAEALLLFTANAAQVAGWGRERGRIAPGYLADMALWDRDWHGADDPEEVLKAKVAATFLGGELVYQG